MGLLTRIDYLSTVSGGGYIGGWLAAWIRREIEAAGLADGKAPTTDEAAGRMGAENVQYQLNPNRMNQAMASRRFPLPPSKPALSKAEKKAAQFEARQPGHVVDEEPEPVRHLRSYSRYLTPRSGLFSLDTWALIAIYVRNSFMNILTIVPMAAAMILLLRLAVIPFSSDSHIPNLGQAIWALCVLAPLLIAYLIVGIGLRGIRVTPIAPDSNGDEKQSKPVAAGSGWWGRFILIVALFFSAGIGLYVFGRNLSDPTRSRITYHGEKPDREKLRVAPVSRAVATTGFRPNWWIGGLAATIVGIVLGYRRWSTKREFWAAENNVWSMWFGFLYAILWAGVFSFLLDTLLGGEWYGRWGTAALYALLGLAGGGFARLSELLRGTFQFIRGVWQTVAAMLFGALFGFLVWSIIYLLNFREDMVYDPIAVLVFGPPLYLIAAVVAGYVEVAMNGTYMREPEREWRSRLGGYLLMWAIGWVTVSSILLYLPDLLLGVEWGAVAVWAAGALGTYWSRWMPAEKSAGLGGKLTTIIAVLAPALTLVLLIGALSLGVAYALEGLEWPKEAGKWDRFHKSLWRDDWETVLISAGVCALVGSVLLYAVRVNTFSIHSLYANRLIRCYLGASRNNHRWEQWGTDSGWLRDGPTGAPTGVPPPPRSANEFTDFDARDDLPLVQTAEDGCSTCRFPHEEQSGEEDSRMSGLLWTLSALQHNAELGSRGRARRTGSKR